MSPRTTPRRQLLARIKTQQAEIAALRRYIKDITGHDVGLDIDLARALKHDNMRTKP